MNFVHNIFNGIDSLLSKRLIDDVIVGKRDSLFVDFSVSSLKKKSSNGLSGRISEGDIRFNSSEHIR